MRRPRQSRRCRRRRQPVGRRPKPKANGNRDPTVAAPAAATGPEQVVCTAARIRSARSHRRHLFGARTGTQQWAAEAGLRAVATAGAPTGNLLFVTHVFDHYTQLCVQTCKVNFSSEQLGERAVIGTPRNTVHPNSVFYCRKPSFLRRKYLLTTSHGPSYILVPYVASTAAVPTRLGLRPRLLVAKLGITADVLAASAVVVVVVTAVAAAGCPARHRSRRWR